MKDIYDAIYEMKVGKEIEKGWYKLKWQPIWRGTYSFYISTPWWSSYGSFWHNLGTWFKNTSFGFGIWGYRSDATNGWGRSYKHGHIYIRLICITINFWIAWRFHVMGIGPQDVAEKDKKPLDLSKKNRV